ncbi:2Fe-2S iron-sulfur cluster-binding protein [Streptomyces shaanxiensis]
MDGQVTHRVAVRPLGVELEVLDGEDLFTAAQRLGYRWPTLCGGKGTCRTCFVQVDEGAENCSPWARWNARASSPCADRWTA